MSAWHAVKWGDSRGKVPSIVPQAILWLIGIMLTGMAVGLLLHTVLEGMP
jgi:hypothetical protein